MLGGSKKIINIVGSIFGTSGYCVHTRELANALCKQTDVRLTTNLTPDCEKDMNDNELKMIKAKPEKDEINLIIDLPTNWRLHTKKGRNIAYCIWEGNRVPDCFIDEFMNEDIEYILVPSMHTQDAIDNTLIDMDIPITSILNKVKIIPHGVDLEKFYPKETKRDAFTFLANKGFRNMQDRGGIQYLIKAYLEEFKKEENVELIVKLNPAYGIPDIKSMFKIDENSPKISLISTEMPYNKLVNLYNSCDVFVSPTRAEAFNLPCIEAMACGKPVITTNFGGQTDYVNDSNGWLVGGELNEIQHEVMYESCSWMTPSIIELRETMRGVFVNNDYDKPKLEIADKGKASLKKAKQMTWDNTAKLIVDLL